MKISCEVIQDLLPLYQDKVCSEDSKALIEEHLAGCAACRAELQAIAGEVNVAHTERNLAQAEAVKNISKKWKSGLRKSLWKGILSTAFIAALVILLLYTFIDIRIVTTP